MHMHLKPAGRTCLAVVVLTVAFAAPARAGDWPQWRGPERNGISRETAWRAEFPPQGPKRLWQANVGLGHAAVSVAEGRAYTTGNENDRDTLYCLDAVSGEVQWEHSYPEPLLPRSYQGGTTSTPTIHDGRVYVISKSGHLRCLEAKSGSVLWEKNLAAEIRAEQPTWGFASSVLIDGDRAVVNVGTHGAAVDRRTGRLLWSTGRAASGYATPVPFESDGQAQYLIFAAKELVAVRADNGRVAWKFPWKTSYDVNAADPIVAGPGRIFITSGYNHGCALLEVRDGRPAAVWENRNLRGQLNAPVLIDGHLYGFDGDTGRAQLVCMELASGAVKWTFRDPRHGALTAAAGKLIVIGETGELLIAEANPHQFMPVSRAQIAGGTYWTTPVLANGLLYLRSAQGRLTCLDLREPTVAPAR